MVTKNSKYLNLIFVISSKFLVILEKEIPNSRFQMPRDKTFKTSSEGFRDIRILKALNLSSL